MNLKLNLPTAATLILSAAAGVVIAFVGSHIIVLEPQWVHGVEVGVTILALFGISPLTGASFRAILHLSNAVATLIAAALGVLVILLAEVHMSLALHGILAGVVVFAAGLGFAPAVLPAILPTPVKAPRR